MFRPDSGTGGESALAIKAERHPIGARVLDWSRAQVAIMRPDPHARALNAVVRDLANTCDGATYIAGRVWGVLKLQPRWRPPSSGL
jgi:hypothetical protein